MIKEVVKACVAFGEAFQSGDYVKARNIAVSGERDYPGETLPQNATWDGLIKMATAKIGPAPVAEPVQAPAAEPVKAAVRVIEVPAPVGPFGVFGPDGEEFGTDDDLASCIEVVAELGAGYVVRDSGGALVHPLPVTEPEPEPEPEPVKETLKEKLARVRAQKAAEQQSAPAAPAPSEPELTAPAALRIVHDGEYGTTVYGTVKGDGANEVLKPLGLRYFFRKEEQIGVWYIQGSKGYQADQDKILAIREALVGAGFEVELEIHETDADGQAFPVKLTKAQRDAQLAAERAERKAAAQVAADKAAADRAAAEQVLMRMPGLEAFAAAAASLSAPAPAAPAAAAPAAVKRTRRTTAARKPSTELEGLATAEGALWWRMAVKDGVSAKETATAVRQALRTVTEAHDVDGEERLNIEVRLHKATRTLLIAAVLPERDTATIERKLVEVQVPGVASIMVPAVGSLVESHSDF
jgi:hypothetical protein